MAKAYVLRWYQIPLIKFLVLEAIGVAWLALPYLTRKIDVVWSQSGASFMNQLTFIYMGLVLAWFCYKQMME